jgi:hypothetical protein
LDAWFGDKNLFIKDLMQDIRSVTPIKDGDDEHLMDYYVTLQAHIEEARSAGALDMSLIPANVELMVLPLTTWEKRVWREAQGRLPAEDRSWYMDVFVNERPSTWWPRARGMCFPRQLRITGPRDHRLRRAEEGGTAAPDRSGGTRRPWS